MLNPNSLTVKPAIGRSEYGRVKVALPRGKGFLDWVRLTTGKIIAKKRIPIVDHVELSKHQSRDDCWIHIFGDVYDVTEYLDFHPGGVPELMRAAGGDATDLFNQFHAWVNYQSMLKACLVGKFVGDLSKLPKNGPTTLDDPSSDSKKNDVEIRIDNFQSSINLKNLAWAGVSLENFVFSSEKYQNDKYRIKIAALPFEKTPSLYSLDLPRSLKDVEFVPTVSGSTLDLKFALKSNQFDDFLKAHRVSCTGLERKGVDYHKCTIEEIENLTHDVILFHLKLPTTTKMSFPPGFHCSVKIRKGEAVLFRPYTPIRGKNSSTIDLLVKIYEDGIGTPTLAKLQKGDFLEISDPIGSKNFKNWCKDATNVVALAAGTGITPMVDVIRAILGQSDTKITLAMFNKKSEDLLTTQESENWPLPEWMKSGEIKIINVLSEETRVDCEFGRVNVELIRKMGLGTSGKAFLCGPDGFVDAGKRALLEADFLEDDIHVFQG